MKTVACVLGVLLLTCAPTSAQTGVTGTWEVEVTFPWQVVLRADGSKLTGAVSQCLSGRVDMFDGHIEGNTLTFKCKSQGADQTVTFTGVVNGDQIAFTQEVRFQDQTREVPPNMVGLFGPSAPRRFTVRRVPDGDLAEFVDRVRGVELAAAVNLPRKDVKVEGTLFLPRKVGRVRAVIVVIRYGIGGRLYYDPQWQRLAEALESGLLAVGISNISTERIGDVVRRADLGGAEGLLLLLQRLAQESGRREIADTPVLLWGHSGAGSFAATFAALHPQRTIGFVRYHTAGSGLEGTDLTGLNPIPVLFMNPESDQSNARVQALWKSQRTTGAPWTFALEPYATHGGDGPNDLKRANDLVIPWITAIVHQRLSPNGTTLRAVTDKTAWLGNIKTGEAAPHVAFRGAKAEASWLPDEATARGWQIVVGAAK